MTEPDLLTRISNVCDYYRGAEWELLFQSAEGGYWSLKLTNPLTESEEEQQDGVPPFLLRVFGAPTAYPVFAIRCQELDVVAEALEHWHASVLSKAGREDVPGV